MAEVTCGCSGNNSFKQHFIPESKQWVEKYLNTKLGKVPIVKAQLNRRDIFAGWKARWGIGRMRYQIKPGIYGINSPDENSPILVTANYKLTFDKLRKELSGINAWVLVLDTKGINVWCAAGKGTFGTKELVNKMIAFPPDQLVKHRDIILPQLGATGVAAHTVKAFTRFTVHYGPVRAADIPAYLNHHFIKTEEMKRVSFNFIDRLVLIPVELTTSFLLTAIVFCLYLLYLFITRQFSWNGILGFIPFVGAFLAGNVLVPILLPWIPGRAFVWKGFIMGLMASIVSILLLKPSLIMAIAYFLILPAISGFVAMNFTGASTFTSLAGAKLEVKIGLPMMIMAAVAGIALLFLTGFKVV
jgi:hypothetical protein